MGIIFSIFVQSNKFNKIAGNTKTTDISEISEISELNEDCYYEICKFLNSETILNFRCVCNLFFKLADKEIRTRIDLLSLKMRLVRMHQNYHDSVELTQNMSSLSYNYRSFPNSISIELFSDGKIKLVVLLKKQKIIIPLMTADSTWTKIYCVKDVKFYFFQDGRIIKLTILIKFTKNYQDICYDLESQKEIDFNKIKFLS